MTEPILIDQLASDVWHLYKSDAENAEADIEAFLQEKFRHLPDGEKLKILEKLVAEFEGAVEQPPAGAGIEIDEDLMAQISALLLGKQVFRSDLSSEELARRLWDSLNTIFDALNHLIGIINKTLGGAPDNDKTIRQVIGSQLEGAASSTPLEAHIGQINNAFLTVQRSFKETALNQVLRILDEIDPERIGRETPRSWKPGPFRKADCFESYTDKFDRIKRWVDSGNFMEGFLREFEKKCQDLSKKHGSTLRT
ncbi:MAG: hypothetical protein R6T92_11580 [Desulfosalsimonadaceae bacterium]